MGRAEADRFALACGHLVRYPFMSAPPRLALSEVTTVTRELLSWRTD